MKKEKCIEIINGLQEAVIVVDRDYRIYDVNEAECLITEMDRDQIIGSHCYEITHLGLLEAFPNVNNVVI